MDFVIDPEIETLLNPLTDEERTKLEASIAREGCRDAGVVGVLPDGTRILADGHNRGIICADFGIDFKTVEIAFKDRESLIQWVIDNQFARRNLTEERKAYYRGKEYLNTKKSPVFYDSEATSESVDTAKVVGEKHGVSDRTIRSDATFAKAVDALPQPEKEAVLNGVSGQTKKAIVNGAKPVLCDRCQRTGAVKDCERCIEARKASRKRKPIESESEDATVDGWGIPIAPHAKAAFADVEKFDELLNVLFQARKLFSALADSPGGKFLQRPNVSLNRKTGWAHQGIENAIKAVKDNKPKYTCCPNQWSEAPGYKHGKDCQTCYGLCWIPDIDETTIQPETIAKAKKDNGIAK